MRKILLSIFVCGIFILELTGCESNKKVPTTEELNDINNKIIEYFSTNGVEDYENYIFNYIDEENNIVVVGLLDNSEKEQEKFKKNVVDSNFIKFVKGEKPENYQAKANIEKWLNKIVNAGPNTSSNPYDYIRENQEEYDQLLQSPQITFEYAIKDLITTNANNGLKGYIEALLCQEINKNFVYDFVSAPDFLDHYKQFLSEKSSNFNNYDQYALSLLK